MWLEEFMFMKAHTPAEAWFVKQNELVDRFFTCTNLT